MNPGHRFRLGTNESGPRTIAAATVAAETAGRAGVPGAPVFRVAAADELGPGDHVLRTGEELHALPGGGAVSVVRSALFSECNRYRYLLRITWDASLPVLAVVGLNPSTADEHRDDPTLRRCRDYARRWGYGALAMLNLFAYRATDLREMKRQADPVGTANDAVLETATAGRRVLCAWGAHGSHRDRDAYVLGLLGSAEFASHRRELVALGLTRSGAPRHPLYVRADAAPIAYPPPADA